MMHIYLLERTDACKFDYCDMYACVVVAENEQAARTIAATPDNEQGTSVEVDRLVSIGWENKADWLSPERSTCRLINLRTETKARFILTHTGDG